MVHVVRLVRRWVSECPVLRGCLASEDGDSSDSLDKAEFTFLYLESQSYTVDLGIPVEVTMSRICHHAHAAEGRLAVFQPPATKAGQQSAWAVVLPCL